MPGWSALSARTQGELAALVADLPAASAPKDVLVVEQRGGTWTRAGRWTVPNRIELRTQLCRITFDFTNAVITSRALRIDMDMQQGKLVIVGAPGIVIDADGLNPVFSNDQAPLGQCRRRPPAPHRARRNAQAREGRRAAAVSPQADAPRQAGWAACRSGDAERDHAGAEVTDRMLITGTTRTRARAPICHYVNEKGGRGEVAMAEHDERERRDRWNALGIRTDIAHRPGSTTTSSAAASFKHTLARLGECLSTG